MIRTGGVTDKTSRKTYTFDMVIIYRCAKKLKVSFHFNSLPQVCNIVPFKVALTIRSNLLCWVYEE